jgi:hypothetical protein
MKSLGRALMAAAIALSATAANAESVSVKYLVQRKPLIAAMQASDKLTFRFYSDAKCTTAAATIQVVASSPGIHFERVKAQRIKGVEGADFLRIGAVLEDFAPTNANFLLVEGPGISPAKEACQPRGVPGDTVPSLHFVDTSVSDELLEIAGVGSIEELRTSLQKGQVPANVTCELLAEILSQGGTEVPVGICSGDGGAAPLDLFESLLDRNS